MWGSSFFAVESFVCINEYCKLLRYREGRVGVADFGCEMVVEAVKVTIFGGAATTRYALRLTRRAGRFN